MKILKIRLSDAVDMLALKKKLEEAIRAVEVFEKSRNNPAANSYHRQAYNAVMEAKKDYYKLQGASKDDAERYAKSITNAIESAMALVDYYNKFGRSEEKRKEGFLG